MGLMPGFGGLGLGCNFLFFCGTFSPLFHVCSGVLGLGLKV